MCGNNAVGAEGCSCMSTFCHAPLKIALLLHKMANELKHLSVTVDLIKLNCYLFNLHQKNKNLKFLTIPKRDFISTFCNTVPKRSDQSQMLPFQLALQKTKIENSSLFLKAILFPHFVTQFQIDLIKLNCCLYLHLKNEN